MMRKVLFFSAIVALFAFAAAEPELKSVGDMKAYLLDLGSKVDFLNWKLDAFQKVVNITDDILEKIGDGAGYVWEKIENKTEAVWEKVQDHKNKTETLFG